VGRARGGAGRAGGAGAASRLGRALRGARDRKEDPIDHAVGIVVHAKPGDEVAAGQLLAHVHARDDTRAESAAAEVLAAYAIDDGPVVRPPLLLETIG
jgi:thymidine phosphorylase